MLSGNKSDDEPMSMEILEDIRDGSKYYLSVNRREARYKICDLIKQIQEKWKGALLSTQKIGKGLHKVLRAAVNEISHVLPFLGESGLEVSYFIPEPQKLCRSDQID